MQLWELKKKVIEKEVPNLLILTGEETTLIRIYINKIEEVYGAKIIEQESVETVIKNSNVHSLLAETNLISIVKNDKSFTTNEALWSKFESFNKILIVVYDSIDKRSKFYKTFENNIVVFDRLEPIVLKSKIKELVRLTDIQCDWLIKATGGDYSRILNELDKIIVFNSNNPENLMERFITYDAIHSELPDCLFDFTNAVIARQKGESLRLYEILKERRESNIKLLSLLYTNFRNQISYQMGNNVTPENSGLTKYQIYLAQKQQGKYSNKELLNALKLIRELDTGIKQGTIEESMTIDLFLVSCL